MVVEDEEKTELRGLCMGPVGKDVSWDGREPWGDANYWVDKKNSELRRQWAEEGGKPETNLDKWLEIMDWSQLEELSINTGRTPMADAISKMPQRLTSLKALHLDTLPFITSLNNHTLKALKWIGTTHIGDFDTILSHQGQNLTSLEYRCNERSCPTWPSHVPLTTLQFLPHLAPNIKSIAINLPRNANNTWPLAHLSALANHPSLTHLDLYFRLQSECKAKEALLGYAHTNCNDAYTKYKSWMRSNCRLGDAFYSSPRLSASSALSMFSFLRSENTSKNLTSVTFRAGDWGAYENNFWGADMWPNGPWFISHRRSAVYCRIDGGREVCEADQARSSFDWEWDGETWVVVGEFEDYDDAWGDEGKMERVKERMRVRLDEFEW
ncbi:hypothetical protein SLS59_004612 [Nothophoma quercina]|uniref:Uncharacterized protein n=1 Tax=Nothophoma quercina TaxID=749835 RepID=A0ABR3RF17_9PLEO